MDTPNNAQDAEERRRIALRAAFQPALEGLTNLPLHLQAVGFSRLAEVFADDEQAAFQILKVLMALEQLIRFPDEFPRGRAPDAIASELSCTLKEMATLPFSKYCIGADFLAEYCRNTGNATAETIGNTFSGGSEWISAAHAELSALLTAAAEDPRNPLSE